MIHPSDNQPAVTVTTYNIHRCVGRDGVKSPQRIAAVINETRPAVVGLQEVDSRYGTAHDHQLDFIAAATDMRGIAGPVTVRNDGHYGNALLTREPVHAVRRHDLSVPGREPRGALDVDLLVAGQVLRVIVAHLGLRPAERRRQVVQLIGIIDQRRTVPTVLMGDFNEWLWWGRPLRWLSSRMGDSLPHPTFPAGLPLLALDKIWAAPSYMVGHRRVHRSPLARAASDHLPVTALCRLPLYDGMPEEAMLPFAAAAGL